LHRGNAGSHTLQPAQFRQLGDQRFVNVVGEIILGGIPGKIFQR
jgi:hypothetical protein